VPSEGARCETVRIIGTDLSGVLSRGFGERWRPGWLGAGDVVNVMIAVALDPELDPEAGERVARQLRAEIAELDIDSVRAVPGGMVPEGAKGTDAVTAGAVVLALGASGGVFTALIETLRDWLGRQSAQNRISLTIDGDTIELEQASAAERRDLVDAYIRRHAGG
jgi:Effector Associated Constant Component 1